MDLGKRGWCKLGLGKFGWVNLGRTFVWGRKFGRINSTNCCLHGWKDHFDFDRVFVPRTKVSTEFTPFDCLDCFTRPRLHRPSLLAPSRIPCQATNWELRGYKRKPGQPQVKTGCTLSDEIWRIWALPGMKPKNWRERYQRQRVAQCIHLDERKS